MKNIITLFFILTLLAGANAQTVTSHCPNQGTDVTGHLGWRLKDPSTNAVITTAPAPSTLYILEIYETPYNPGTGSVRYPAMGIKGIADGFKLYSSVWYAQNYPNDYFSDATIASGVGPDTSTGVATMAIKTLDASDPNWTGQITAFKAYGHCSVVGGGVRYFTKTLIFK